MFRITLAIIFGLFAFVFTHPQFRQLKCVKPNDQLKARNNETRCQMIIKDLETETPGRPAPVGEGCFTEIVKGEKRQYCDLVCPKAHAVFNSHIDHVDRACFNFYTYQLEQRGDEWFIWRSGKCLNSTATFTIGCKFDEPFSTQFANDNEIFAHLRARTSKI